MVEVIFTCTCFFTHFTQIYPRLEQLVTDSAEKFAEQAVYNKPKTKQIPNN